MRAALILLAFAAPALAGCGLSRVVGGQVSSAYTPMEVIYAFNDRDARVRVIGNPFGGDTATFERRVTDFMQHRAMGVATRFTTTPDESARPGYHLVIAFNPVHDGLTGRICHAPPPPTQPPQAGPPYRLYVEAAFCGGGDYTTARGWLDAATGPDDPHFRSLVGDLTSTLFPRGEQDSCGGPDC